jgi:hypothetical protein
LEAVRWKLKESFEVPDSRLVECGTVSTGKRRLFLRRILLTSSGSSSERIMAFYLQNG